MSNPYIPAGAQMSSGVLVSPPQTIFLTPTQELDAEIIQVLDGTGNCPGCVGGLTQNELLPRLQAEFPMSNWNASLLQNRLRAGLREGRLCQTSSTRYGMRQDMVIVNSTNSVFIPFSNNIKVPPGMLGFQASVNGVFDGNNPCSLTLTNPFQATAVSIIEPQLVASAFLSNHLFSE